ncbi:MAG: hypothetical protein MUC96_02965, partial [Myxococcaceae bacterium]|nr:hypothetical protein [Myxococcaceae bacterium]
LRFQCLGLGPSLNHPPEVACTDWALNPTPERLRRLTLTEERECLIQQLAVYLSDPKRKKDPEPHLERLLKVQKAGLLDVFIVYELLSTSEPHITLTTDAQGLAALEQYIQRFVFEVR